MEKMGIAAQVYSVREAAEKDFAGTMKALRECGYEGVELAGLYGLSPEAVRDCLAEAVERLEAAGVPVVFHIHDEVVCEVPRGRADLQRWLIL